MTSTQNRIMVRKPWKTYTHLSLYPDTRKWRMSYVVDYLDRMKIISTKKPKSSRKKQKTEGQHKRMAALKNRNKTKRRKF